MTAPSKDPKDSCSEDIALARRLSQRLTGARVDAPAPAPYTRFAPPKPSTPAPPPPPPTFRVPRSVDVGQEGWNKLLRDVQAFASAAVVFAIDASGLMVAASPPSTPREELEGMGSRLLVALEHADRMTGRASRSLAIDLGDRVLTGIRVRAADGVTVTLALLTRGPLPDTVRTGLYPLLPE